MTDLNEKALVAAVVAYEKSTGAERHQTEGWIESALSSAIQAYLSALTNTSGDDEAATIYETHDGKLFSTKDAVIEYCDGRTYALGMMGWSEKKISDRPARPQSAAVRDEDPGLLSIIKRMLENPATMVTDFGHPERATLTITFDTHDGAWAFMHAAGDARRALHSTQEG